MYSRLQAKEQLVMTERIEKTLIEKQKKSICRQFSSTFWIANTMEIFERMAWYGFFALSSLYITGSVESGGLGFTSEIRGLLQGVVTFFIYLFPFFTGALGDRYGFKKMLLISYCVLAPSLKVNYNKSGCI